MAKQLSKIFISSTYSELAPYRRAVVDAIEQVGLQPIWYEKMDGYDPRLSETIEDLLKSAAVFVLIVGFRYGPLLSGRTAVELEFATAKILRKPVLAFVMSQDAMVPPAAIDVDRSQIESFRNRIVTKPCY